MRATLLAAAGLASLASVAQAAPPVRTTSGVLTGVPGKNSASTTAYLGIPYAQPPVGALRFRAPVRLHTHNATRGAAKYGQDCPGTINLGGAGPGVPGVTDDCLYLNVWVPDQSKGDKAKAVLLFFYGGAFVGGGTSSGYDSSLLAGSQDVIVVTTNYRLSIFGYPGSPNLKDQNPGLLDQRMSVEWVRDNIAAFGGDPKRIVLFGQSAGADSVDLYSHAWHDKDPIVSGLISQSGASTMCGLWGRQSTKNWKVVATTLGCTDAAKELECMQSKPTAQVVDAAKNVPRTGMFPPAFVPVIDNKVVFEDYNDRAAKGQFLKVPYIIGNNDKELGPQETMADAEFTCTSAQVANSRAKAGVPSWRYRFFGGGPAEAGAKATGLAALAASTSSFHGSELPYVFGGIQAASLFSRPSPQKVAVSNEMMSVWAAFAKDPAKGPLQYGWPLYNPKGDTLVRLYYKAEAKHSLEQGDKYDGRCAVDLCKDPNNYSSAPGLGGLEALGKLGSLGKNMPKLGDLMKGLGKFGKQGAKNAMI